LDDIINKILIQGYKNAKIRINDADEYNVVEIPDISKLLQQYESLGIWYDREFDEQRPEHIGQVTAHKLAFKIIKTLHHIRLVYQDKSKVQRVYDKKNEPSAITMYANEILCWEILMVIYRMFIDDIEYKNKDEAYPPFCDRHFSVAKESFVRRLFRSRIRIGEISASYIELLFESLMARHLNIAHHSTRRLYNQSGFVTQLEYWGDEYSGDDNIKLGVLHCDIDKFKQVNDDAGHAEGDRIIREMTDIMADVCRTNNGVAGRVGGEEFWMAFIGDDDLNIESIYNELKSRFKNEVPRPKYNNDRANGAYKEYMTISAAGGVVPLTNGCNSDEVYRLFNILDEGVYRVKDRGRDNIEVIKRFD